MAWMRLLCVLISVVWKHRQLNFDNYRSTVVNSISSGHKECKIDKIFFTKLVSDEVEVAFASKRVHDQPDHLVKRHAALHHVAREAQVRHAWQKNNDYSKDYSFNLRATLSPPSTPWDEKSKASISPFSHFIHQLTNNPILSKTQAIFKYQAGNNLKAQ